MPTIDVAIQEKEWIYSLRRLTPGVGRGIESASTVMKRIHENYKEEK
jgi:hypothetical protein